MGDKMITDVLNNYDQEEITIGEIGSHSFLFDEVSLDPNQH